MTSLDREDLREHHAHEQMCSGYWGPNARRMGAMLRKGHINFFGDCLGGGVESPDG